MNRDSQLTISQVFGALKRHRYKAAFAWLLVMVLVTLIFLLLPKKYGSEGQLYVQLGRNNSPISPTSGSASISVQDTRETEIRSVVEIISSRAVLEAVAQDIGAEEILASPWDAWMPSIEIPEFPWNKTKTGDLSLEEYQILKDREKAAKAISESLEVVAEKKTSIVKLYVKAYSPGLAQRIADKIMEHTRDVHLKVHSSDVSAVFFDKQFADQEKKLQSAIKRLAEFRKDRNVLSVGAERATVQGILGRLENELLGAEIAVEKSTEGLKKLQALLAQTEAQIAVPKTGVERLSYEDSRTEVFKLEAERDRLVSAYSPIHPQVQQVDQQLQRVRSSLSAMTDDRTESAMTQNPVYEQITIDLVRAETGYATALANLETVKKKQEEYFQKLDDLNDAETVADQLQRDVSVAREYLGNYTQKRGEAMTMALLDDGKVSDLSTAQDATLGLKHISPRGSLLLPLGFVAGLLASLATALFCERNYLSPSLDESAVEKILGVPVLVTLPRVYSTRNMVN